MPRAGGEDKRNVVCPLIISQPRPGASIERQAVNLSTVAPRSPRSTDLAARFSRLRSPCATPEARETWSVPYYFRPGRELGRIARGCQWNKPAEPIIARGARTDAELARCEELGATLASGSACVVLRGKARARHTAARRDTVAASHPNWVPRRARPADGEHNKIMAAARETGR